MYYSSAPGSLRAPRVKPIMFYSCILFLFYLDAAGSLRAPRKRDGPLRSRLRANPFCFSMVMHFIMMHLLIILMPQVRLERHRLTRFSFIFVSFRCLRVNSSIPSSALVLL